MFFVIDKSILKLIKNIDKNTKLASAFENIAQARISGKHILFGDRETLSFLSKERNLSQIARSTYHKIYESLPQIKTLYDHFDYKVHIVSDETVTPTNNYVPDNDFKVPVENWFQISFALEPVFLSENQIDLKFYNIIAKTYLSKYKIGKIPIRFDPRGGGGSTTYIEYETIAEKKDKFCLCIVDADYKFPKSSTGETARKIIEIHNKYKPRFSRYYIIKSREIENLIPNKIFKDIIKDQRSKYVDFLINSEKNNIHDVKRYIDIKEKVEIKEIVSSENNEYKNFWIDIFNKLHKKNIKKINCFPDFVCDPNECNCVLFVGFGDKILEQSVDYMEKMTPQKISECDNEKCFEDWNNLGKFILSFCCGSESIHVF